MKPAPSIERLPLIGALAAALASSLCCVLPFVLVSIGITGPWLARLQIFEPYRIPFDVASVAVLALAWTTHVVRVRSCGVEDGCALPRTVRRTRIGLLVATVLVGIIISAPYAIAYLGGS